MKIDHSQIKKILVVALGGIGNLVLMRPALQSLRKGITHARIVLLTGEPMVEAIIAAENLIDDVIFFDRRVKQGLKSTVNFLKDVRSQNFDMVLVSSGMNVLKGGLVTFCMGIPHRVGEDRGWQSFFYNIKTDYVKDEVHELDGALKLVEVLGVETEHVVNPLKVFKDDIKKVDQFLHDQGVHDQHKKLVGMHIGSGFYQTYKRWPKERFAKLADQMVEKWGVKIIVTGGPQEEDLVCEMAELMSSPVIQATGKLSIRETAELIRRCSLFISNDSGLAHIAAAVDTPLIVLFGNTNEKRIAPRGRNVILLKKSSEGLGAILSIDVEDVFSKIDEALLRKG